MNTGTSTGTLTGQRVTVVERGAGDMRGAQEPLCPQRRLDISCMNCPIHAEARSQMRFFLPRQR